MPHTVVSIIKLNDRLQRESIRKTTSTCKLIIRVKHRMFADESRFPPERQQHSPRSPNVLKR